jgi:hypothetical protein
MKRIPQILFAHVFCILLLAGAQAATVDYTFSGNVESASFNLGGITVTGSADVKAGNGSGVAIVGGASDFTVGPNEFIQFSFNNGQAIDVTYFDNEAGDTNNDEILGERTLEAFDIFDVSLGTVSQSDTGAFDVTALFGDVAISSFTLTSPGWDSFKIESVTFSPVPIPAAVWLFGSALGLLGWMRRKAS